jgi:hypothetical protein
MAYAVDCITTILQPKGHFSRPGNFLDTARYLFNRQPKAYAFSCMKLCLRECLRPKG